MNKGVEFVYILGVAGNAISSIYLKTMNPMKSLFASVLVVAAALPASAAVVSWSWSGPGLDSNFDSLPGNVVVSGTITYTGSGTITQANITQMTWQTTGTGGFDNSGVFDSALTISFDSSLLTLSPGSDFRAVSTQGGGLFFADPGDSGTPAKEGVSGSWFVSPDGLGLGDWQAFDGDTTLTLTAVPEPESVALVAGLGLVAFGAARRKFAKR